MQQTLAMIYTGLDRLGPQPAALMLSYFLLEHFNVLHLLCFHDSIIFFMLLVPKQYIVISQYPVK